MLTVFKQRVCAVVESFKEKHTHTEQWNILVHHTDRVRPLRHVIRVLLTQ